ncbi:hypothetical protein ZHAS_00009134 [Anopheles sinensis]|uniref:Uncharacterized protein n=1 Tax=Anopheles sinensis TaxID=74873 RepID=A0A084VU93_ANOSI|nr:hypothetical protein ZHAS_00009134 [Anopheles sinensis]
MGNIQFSSRCALRFDGAGQLQAVLQRADYLQYVTTSHCKRNLKRSDTEHGRSRAPRQALSSPPPSGPASPPAFQSSPRYQSAIASWWTPRPLLSAEQRRKESKPLIQAMAVSDSVSCWRLQPLPRHAKPTIHRSLPNKRAV